VAGFRIYQCRSVPGLSPQGFSVVREFVGHGNRPQLHEAPQLPNFGVRDRGRDSSQG